MTLEELHLHISRLEEKIDRLHALVSERLIQSKIGPPKKVKPKPLPLTTEEIALHKERFALLFGKWMNGADLEVQRDLEGMDVEQLRRFADANNLNVTAKMPRERLLHLISARFREKRQLLPRTI